MAAKSQTGALAAASTVTHKDVMDFSDHCVLIRSVWLFTMRIWRDSDERERKTMEAIAPSIFEDLAQVLREYQIIAACRITDPTNDGAKHENFTVEMFVNSFDATSETFKQLNEPYQRMLKLRAKILPARNKLAAHVDRDAVRKGKLLGHASFEEWEEFWSALQVFVRVLNEAVIGRPFEIDAGGVIGDAESLLKALAHSQHFETLVNGDNPVVAEACLKLALPQA